MKFSLWQMPGGIIYVEGYAIQMALRHLQTKQSFLSCDECCDLLQKDFQAERNVKASQDQGQLITQTWLQNNEDIGRKRPWERLVALAVR